MQTELSPAMQLDDRAVAAAAMLQKCVHCGFCLAACPTYKLLGDELDSPRGRICLIKQVLEGHAPTARTQLHLDRCLTCRSCETTCPSGVDYGHLLDHGRALVEEQVARGPAQRILRSLVQQLLPRRALVTPLVKFGQGVRGLLPRNLRAAVPMRQAAGTWPKRQHPRRMLVLDGCVQPSMTPATNAALARVLDALGISLLSIPESGCCGAVPFHLNNHSGAKDYMRRNIDAWWPSIEAGAEAIIVSASGCGVMVKDYGQVLADDARYRDKASAVSALARDPVEVLESEDLTALVGDRPTRLGRVAFHPPCTLQHGQKLAGVTETLLASLGIELVAVPDAHLCCGSAGTYSLFQPELSRQLRDNKVTSLLSGEPDIIATANVGCQLHLQSGSGRPVRHWVELVDELLA